ncbi:MAG: T9SS type A sorting domain-containing protein [Mesotoga sp.]|uniref:T9SS type A sorting domain-containing protein n=1 Tax=Mesotoga sp. TaxID=2053577 RepID=UPI0035623B6A
MKRYLFCVFLLLPMVVPLMGIPYEQTVEYNQKQAILNERAVRFKAETGFEGDITFNHQDMKCSYLRGTFKDIEVTAPQDTTFMKQVFNQLVSKIVQHISAREEDLLMGKVVSTDSRTSVRYTQMVNGYGIEQGGWLNISYMNDLKLFTVTDNTVSIRTDLVVPTVSIDKAKQIYHELVLQDETNHSLTIPPSIRLMYFNINRYKIGLNPDYRLCWIVGGVKTIVLDAVSEAIYVNKYPIIIHDKYVNVNGTVITSQNDGGYPSSTANLPDSYVQAVCDGDTLTKATNSEGECTFPGNDIAVLRAALQSDRFIVFDYDLPVVNNQSTVVDSVHSVFFFDDINYSGNPCNTYYQATNFFNWFSENLCPSVFLFDDAIRILTNYNLPNNLFSGYSPENGRIYISLGADIYSSVICHEIMHAFVFSILTDFFNPELDSLENEMGCMDESFSMYYPCAYRDNATFRRPNNSVDLSAINSIYPIYNAVVVTKPTIDLNEEFYSYYWCGESVASIWWEIRNRLGNTYFNQFLVDALINDVSPTEPLRYKPRYFYNILMRNSTSSNQLIIDKAYSDRGLHFTPQVISAGVSNPLDDKDKNMFRIGDPVHVKVSNCPQNTPLTVYIVEDQDYTDGMNISALNNVVCQIGPGVQSDSTGVWYSSTPVMTASDVGDYDILVDIGNNGVLHYAYSGANVRDGFDGLDGSGFTVFDDRIEIAISLDQSGSMNNNAQHIQKTAMQFLSCLNPGDRVNVFGFHGYDEDDPNNIDNHVGTSTGMVQIPTNATFTVYTLGGTNLRLPFLSGYERFPTSQRKKGLVLLSDGEHNAHDYYDPTMTFGSIMSLIRNPNYSNIKCYSMAYGTGGLSNMRNIASWGNGLMYCQTIVDNSYRNVISLINDLRSDTGRGENETINVVDNLQVNETDLVPFEVDIGAHKLNIAMLWKNAVSITNYRFELVSPTGTLIPLLPENVVDNIMAHIEILNPESGVWSIEIENYDDIAYEYNLVAMIESDIVVQIAKHSIYHYIDEPLLVSAEVMDYMTPVADAEITVTLSRDDWSMSICLYDDGNHFEGDANDGQYSNYIYPYLDASTHFSEPRGYYTLEYEVFIPRLSAGRIRSQVVYLTSNSTYVYPEVERILHKGWNWTGFPRLNRDENCQSIPYVTASLSPYLTDIHSPIGKAEYRNNYWNYFGLNSLNSIDGYKLQINDTLIIRLFEIGSIVDTLRVHQLYEGQWNWLTYPCFETVYPDEALSGVIDRIDYIMAEDWSMKKDGDVWIYDGFSRPHLKYGDSIMIQTVRDCEFVWNNPLTTPIIVDPRKPTYFVYEDKPNYETIMIESIEGNPDYAEIGVFQDDVCIGARVNEAYPIQILAYSTPVEEGGGPLIFMLYSESKGPVSVSPATFHPGNNIANEQTIEPERYGFRVLTLKTNDQQMPSALALHSNYPNPFNPSTTINFSLPKTAPVRLVIYNIRGQKVKELLNESLEGGNHNVVWNGRDDGNRPVASGVYFTRLEQSGVTKISKMMLMK